MRLGSLAPTQSVLSILRESYDGATIYANLVLGTLGNGQAVTIFSAPELYGVQFARDSLDWQNGSGAQVAAGTLDWSTYRDQLKGYVQSIASVGQGAGMDMGALVSWWDGTAWPRLSNLTVAAAIGQTGQAAGDTVGAGFQAVGGAIPWWAWAIGGVGVLIYFSGFLPRGGGTPAHAGLSGLQRRRRRR